MVVDHLHDRGLHDWMGSWQPVTIFFVISGYLITTLALREESKRGSVSLTAFHIRRMFRIFPTYFLALGLYCLLILGLRVGYAEKGYLLWRRSPDVSTRKRSRNFLPACPTRTA